MGSEITFLSPLWGQVEKFILDIYLKSLVSEQESYQALFVVFLFPLLKAVLLQQRFFVLQCLEQVFLLFQSCLVKLSCFLKNHMHPLLFFNAYAT